MEECPTNHTPPNAFGIAKTQREKSLCVPSFQLRSSILDVLHVLEAAQTLISFSVTLIQVWTVVGSGVRALHTHSLLGDTMGRRSLTDPWKRCRITLRLSIVLHPIHKQGVDLLHMLSKSPSSLFITIDLDGHLNISPRLLHRRSLDVRLWHISPAIATGRGWCHIGSASRRCRRSRPGCSARSTTRCRPCPGCSARSTTRCRPSPGCRARSATRRRPCPG